MSHAEDRAAGFSLIELLIVMVIVMIVGGIVFSTGRGAKQRSGETTTRSVARAYVTAIRSFADEHGSRAPRLNEFNGARGPVTTTAPPRAYLQRRPEDTSDAATARVHVTSGSTIAATDRDQGELRYVRSAAGRDWVVVAYWNGTLLCATGQPGSIAIPANTPAC